MNEDEGSLDSWVKTGDVVKIEIQNRGSVRHVLDIPYRNTYVKITLQAHNELGLSDEAVMIIKAMSGKGSRISNSF